MEKMAGSKQTTTVERKNKQGNAYSFILFFSFNHKIIVTMCTISFLGMLERKIKIWETIAISLKWIIIIGNVKLAKCSSTYTYLKEFWGRAGQRHRHSTFIETILPTQQAPQLSYLGNYLAKPFFGNLFAQYSLTVAVNGYN